MANKFRDIPKQEEIEEIEDVVEAQPQADASAGSASQKPRKKGVLAKGLSTVFSGSFLSNDKAIKHLPFVLFLAFIAILYIANGYYADDKIREVNKVGNQLKESRTEFISVTSDLMFISKQTEVAKAVAPMELKEPLAPPMKIEVDTATMVVKEK